MKKFNFTVEKTVDGYSAFTKLTNGDLVFTAGDTILELQANVLDALNLTLENRGKKVASKAEINFVYDLPQFFDYYKVINTTQLATRLKINRSLLSQYIAGHKKPSQSQTLRILNGVKNLGKELSTIDFI